MYKVCALLLMGIVSTLSSDFAAAQGIRTRREAIRSRAMGESQKSTPIGGAGVFDSASVTIGSVSRAYRLVVPASVDLQKPAPLVIAFHGMLVDSKDLMPRYTHFNELAEKHRFIVAYPNAIDRSWGLKPEKVASDLAFFDAFLIDLRRHYKIDARRIFVAGISNGGYFAHLLGKERSQVIAAVASHSGPLGLQTLAGIGADRKFPVMIIHGDQDPLFPVSIARENRDNYIREGHEVNYVEVPGHGHLWANEIDVSEKIWNFFESHPLPAR